MQDVPEWINRLLGKGKIMCISCSQVMGEDDLISVGIQEATDDPNEDVLVIGVYCSECREVTMVELKKMTLLDLSLEVIESESRKVDENDDEDNIVDMIDLQDKKSQEVNLKSKISKKEIENISDFLKKIKNHEEMLLAMGMSIEEIEKYSFKKTENNKKSGKKNGNDK